MKFLSTILSQGFVVLCNVKIIIGTKDDEKKAFLHQLKHLDGNYAGGLETYLTNAKRLLRDAQDGES